MSTRPSLCASCAHLRETPDPEHAEYFQACGWPLPPLPVAMLRHAILAASDSEAQRWITRKIVAGKSAARIDECPVHRPLTPETEADPQGGER